MLITAAQFGMILTGLAFGVFLGVVFTVWGWDAEPTPLPTPQNYARLDSTATAYVDPSYNWIPIDPTTPRGVTVQLLGMGGCAIYARYSGDGFWTHWAPLPTRQKEAT